MSHITTFTGKKFDPEYLETDREMIEIRDIAHALSLICRGNGHVKQFYSVGQHCIYCALEAEARGYSRNVILGCLLHDASEAYMADVPRPYKHTLGRYREEEDHLLEVIWRKFLGEVPTPQEAALIRQIDDDLLYFDLTELLGIDVAEAAPQIHIMLDYTVKPFEEVERQYLSLFQKWK